MKKILIASYNLEIGGIEKALVNLVKNIDPKAFKVTLLLQEKKGSFLKQIPSHVEIKTYSLSQNKHVALRKIYNRCHLLFYIACHYHQYDTAICYTTYDIPSSILVRYLGKKCIFWVHGDYSYIYDEKGLRTFFDTRKIQKFDQCIFVSNEARDHILAYYPTLQSKSQVINNLIDFEEIKQKAMEKIPLKKKGDTLIYVGRLDEKQKSLLLLFEVMKKFQDEQKSYHLWVVGDGPDRTLYQAYIAKEKLKNIELLGMKENPYPYMKKADLFVLPSKYEGFPVVFLECLVLQKKIVTTVDVSCDTFCLNDYAYITKREKNALAHAIECAFEEDHKKTFDEKTFHVHTKKRIEALLEGKDEV